MFYSLFFFSFFSLPFFVGVCEQNLKSSDVFVTCTRLQSLFRCNGLVNCLQRATWKDVHFIYARFCVIYTDSQYCSYIFGFIHRNLRCPHTRQVVLSWALYANTALHFQPMLDTETIKSQWKILQLPLSVVGTWAIYVVVLLIPPSEMAQNMCMMKRRGNDCICT